MISHDANIIWEFGISKYFLENLKKIVFYIKSCSYRQEKAVKEYEYNLVLFLLSQYENPIGTKRINNLLAPKINWDKL